jgi:hypothetical protein
MSKKHTARVKVQKYRGLPGLIDDQMEELRRLCDSLDEEFIRNEMEKREKASKERHDKKSKEMEKWFQTQENNK